MDDGLQHAALARDLEVILIDALEPFGEGAVVPLGRLREPIGVAGEGRCDCDTVQSWSSSIGVENRIRQANSFGSDFSCANDSG